VEKTIEQNAKGFLLFFDLCNAYGFVPRAALWCTLQKLGVLNVIIELLRYFHDGMSATITAVGGRSESFSVQNCLCTIAPTLYFGLVIDKRLSWCQEAGVEAQFRVECWLERGQFFCGVRIFVCR